MIRSQKAQLISDASELIQSMNWKTRTDASQPVQMTMVGLLDNLSQDQQTILQKLQEAEDGLHINLLVMETERPYSEVSSDLVMLEIQGLVRSLPGGIYRFQQ